MVVVASRSIGRNGTDGAGFVMRSGGRERGSGTVLALAAIGVLCAVLLAGLAIGSALLASAQARTAADLAAVAGAQQLVFAAGDGAVCARAQGIVHANDAVMTSCAVVETDEGPAVTVQVKASAGVLGQATATARAGLRSGQSE